MMKILQSIFILMVCLLFYNNVDAQAPVIVKFAPTDNAQNVSIQVDPAIEFDQVQIGEGTVTIRRQADGSIFEQMDVNGGKVLALFDKFVQINTTNNFAFATGYYVEITAGAFEGLSGEPFAGISDPTLWNFTTGCGQPPANRSVTNITDNSATLNWDAVAGVSGYEVLIGSRGVIDADILTNSYKVADLVSNTTDYFRVRTVCAGGIKSAWSAPVYFTTVCGSPTGLNVSNVTHNSATFSWDAMEEGATYQLWISGMGLVNSNISSTTYNFSGLRSETPFKWGVSVECSEPGFSALTFGPEFITPVNDCTAPSGLAVSNLTHNSAIFSWEAMEEGTTYQLWISGMGLVNTNISSNTYNFSGLRSETSFKWGVRVECSESDYSDLTFGPEFITPANDCTAPSGLAVIDVTDNSATFSWDAMEEGTTYQLWISGMGLVNSNISTNTYTFSGLRPGTSVKWGVRVICSESDFSDLTFGPKFNTLTTESAFIASRTNITNTTKGGIISDEGSIEKSNIAEKEITLRLYPNPSSDRVNIDAYNGSITSIIVIDFKGTVVMRLEEISLNSETISLNEFGTGIYFVKILVDNKYLFNKKIIIK